MAAMKILGLVLLFSARASSQDCGWDQRMPIHAPGDSIFDWVMVFDSARNVSVLYASSQSGHETLEWDGLDWTLRSQEGPSADRGAAMCFDSEQGVVVLSGGVHNEGGAWQWDGETWAHRPSLPGGFTRHVMTYDSARGVIVLFGGYTELGELRGDTFEWDADLQKWKKVAVNGPAPRAGAAAAYDPERHVTVLYGGQPNGDVLADTWEWDGKTWTERDANGPMGPRFQSAMVYDADLHACVLFGGSEGGSPFDLRNDLWAWNGLSWTKLDTTPGVPRARADAAMAYDSVRDAIILFGGRDQVNNPYTDTWEFSCFPPPCYADFTDDGSLDLFDFLAFVNAFNGAELDIADCDQNGDLDLFDFLCFTNAFNAGC